MSPYRAIAASVAAMALTAFLTPAAMALPVPVAGNGGISFGVTGYGAPVPGVPTFIPNNFTGFNDIMSSPGGTFLTANPVIANNIASYPLAPLPVAAVQVGGGNGNGLFGNGNVSISGPAITFGVSDPFAGGGSASYEIGSWVTTYNDAVGSAGNYGNYLSIGGYLPAVGSAAAVSLVTEISSANPLSPFFGGVALPALVLADSEVSPGVYSWVALGGTGAAILTDPIASTFEGLAVNSVPVVIPAGDVFTVTTTLTAYADPASIDEIAPDLTLLPDVQLPGIVFSDAAAPEPGSLGLLVLGASALLVRKSRRPRPPAGV